MSLDSDDPRVTLLHEMAHASPLRVSGGHGPVWQGEIERLIHLGAPSGLVEELAGLQE